MAYSAERQDFYDLVFSSHERGMTREGIMAAAEARNKPSDVNFDELPTLDTLQEDIEQLHRLGPEIRKGMRSELRVGRILERHPLVEEVGSSDPRLDHEGVDLVAKCTKGYGFRFLQVKSSRTFVRKFRNRKEYPNLVKRRGILVVNASDSEREMIKAFERNLERKRVFGK